LGPGRDFVAEKEAPPDVSWTTLVELGRLLAGVPQAEVTPHKTGAGLMAPEQESADHLSFPPSEGVVAALRRAFGQFTHGHDLEDVRPDSMPGDVTTRIPSAKFAKTFNAQYHGGAAFPMAVKSLQPSAEEKAYLRPGADPAVPIAKVGELEYLMRKNVRSLSSLDWLLRTLKEVYSLPNQDASVIEALWGQVTRTLTYSTDFASGTLMSAIVMRREAFLRGCDSLKVPRRTHTWAALRPPFGSASLLGDTAEVLRKASRDDRDDLLVSSLSRQNCQTSRPLPPPPATQTVVRPPARPSRPAGPPAPTSAPKGSQSGRSRGSRRGAQSRR
jgi:hypothetical protein